MRGSMKLQSTITTCKIIYTAELHRLLRNMWGGGSVKKVVILKSKVLCFGGFIGTIDS